MLRWFWWLGGIAFVLIAASQPVSTAIVGFDSAEVVVGCGVVGLVLTVIIIRTYLQHQKTSDKIS